MLASRARVSLPESRLDEVRLGSGVWYVNVGVGAADIFNESELQVLRVIHGARDLETALTE